MDDVQHVMNILQKKREYDSKQEQLEDLQKKKEYNNLLQKIKSSGDIHVQIIQSITKNFNSLILQKHSIIKALQSVNPNDEGLPFSKDYQEQAMNTCNEAVKFIGDLKSLFTNIHDINNINFTNLVKDILACIKSVETEMQRIKTFVDQVKTLNDNTEALLVNYVYSCDEAASLEGSYF